jgi:hypothetical protein
MHGDTACPERPKTRLAVKTEEAGGGVHYANHCNKRFQLNKGREILCFDNQDDKAVAA